MKDEIETNVDHDEDMKVEDEDQEVNSLSCGFATCREIEFLQMVEVWTIVVFVDLLKKGLLLLHNLCVNTLHDIGFCLLTTRCVVSCVTLRCVVRVNKR